MSIRDTAAQFGLQELKRPEVTIYASRADYRQKTGQEAPPYNPDLPNKHWAWTAPSTQKVVSFLLPELQDGIPTVQMMSIPLSYAQSVNIPFGEANAEDRYSAENLAFPVEPLRLDEYLAVVLGGIVVVRNRNRFTEPVEGFEWQVLQKLEAIARKLGV